MSLILGWFTIWKYTTLVTIGIAKIHLMQVVNPWWFWDENPKMRSKSWWDFNTQTYTAINTHIQNFPVQRFFELHIYQLSNNSTPAKLFYLNLKSQLIGFFVAVCVKRRRTLMREMLASYIFRHMRRTSCKTKVLLIRFCLFEKIPETICLSLIGP